MWMALVTIIILLIVIAIVEIALISLFIIGIKDKDWATMVYGFIMFLLIGLLFLCLLYYGLLGGY